MAEENGSINKIWEQAEELASKSKEFVTKFPKKPTISLADDQPLVDLTGAEDIFSESLDPEQEFRKEFFIKYSQTTAYKKAVYYFLSVIKQDEVKRLITEARKLCKIPPRGFSRKSYMDKLYLPYENWDYDESIDKSFLAETIKKICDKYELSRMAEWDQVLRDYIIFNQVDTLPDDIVSSGKSLIRVRNFSVEQEFLDGGGQDAKMQMEENAELAKHFPVGICISPYASERDVLDFVKKMYSSYVGYWLGYEGNIKSKIGRIRKKDYYITKRNDLIFRNKNKSKAQIRKLLKDQFKDLLPENRYWLDDGALTKIISLETKQRKEL